MSIVVDFILLLIGFILLIKGAQFVVDHASNLALKAGIPMFIVGLTLVAFGTSLPELSVSLISAIKAYQLGSSADIAVGNIVGSNMANLGLILGSSALIAPILVHKRILVKDVPFLIGISALFILFMRYFDNTYRINRFESAILILFFIYYVYTLLKENTEDEAKVLTNTSVMKSVIFLVIGFIGVIFGGNLVTSSAESMATSLLVDVFNMNPLKVTTLVGLSIVAVGTSLPELVTTLVAMKKGSHDIAVGNVIGSNIFNLLLVGGLSGVIVPLGINNDVIIDATLTLALLVITYVWMKSKIPLHKLFGFVLLGLYASYMLYIILRTL